MQLLHSPLDSNPKARSQPCAGQRHSGKDVEEPELNPSLHYPSFSAHMPGSITRTTDNEQLHVTIAHEAVAAEEEDADCVSQDGESLCPRSVDTLTEIEIVDEDDDDPRFDAIVEDANTSETTEAVGSVISDIMDSNSVPQPDGGFTDSDQTEMILNSSQAATPHSAQESLPTSHPDSGFHPNEVLDTGQTESMLHASEVTTNQSDHLLQVHMSESGQSDLDLVQDENIPSIRITEGDSPEGEQLLTETEHEHMVSYSEEDPSAPTSEQPLEQVVSMIEPRQQESVQTEQPLGESCMRAESAAAAAATSDEAVNKDSPTMQGNCTTTSTTEAADATSEQNVDESMLSLPPVSCALQSLTDSCIMDKVNQHSMAAGTAQQNMQQKLFGHISLVHDSNRAGFKLYSSKEVAGLSVLRTDDHDHSSLSSHPLFLHSDRPDLEVPHDAAITQPWATGTPSTTRLLCTAQTCHRWASHHAGCL